MDPETYTDLLAKARAEVAATLQEARQLRLLLTAAERLFRVQAFDEILDSVLSATRTLLGCDLAHVNLQGADDPGRRQSIRALDGALTEAFRQQRTPAGSGLTGKVAESRSPYATLDYLADQDIRHDPLGDASVRAEGLRSMVGVPLFRNDDVIGVLMAGYRRRIPVGMSQISTLSTLGSLAALALNSARLHEEKLRAVADLRRANQQLQAGTADLESSAVAHDRLTTLVLRGAGAVELVAAVADILGASCVALGPDGAPLEETRSQDTPLHTVPREEWRRTSPAGRAQRLLVQGDAVVWVVPVTAAGEVLGGIALRRPDAPDLTPLEIRTLERAGVVLALVLTREQAVAEARHRMTSDVLLELITADADDQLDRERATQVGLREGDPYVVLVVRAPGQDRGAAQTIRTFAGSRTGLATRIGTDTVVVVPSTDAEQTAADLARRLDSQDPGTDSHGVSGVAVGASGPLTSLTRLPQAFREAEACARARQRLGGAERWATSASLGHLGLLLGAGGSGRPAEFVERSIGPVLDYDDRRGTHLRETLECYLETDRSLQKAAHLLNVHPNTVTQRLGRVGDLLGDDWQEHARLLDVQVALRLRRLQDG